MNFKKYLKKYEPVLRNFPEIANRFLRSERFLVYLVSLPFFGTWLIGFTFIGRTKRFESIPEFLS